MVSWHVNGQSIAMSFVTNILLWAVTLCLPGVLAGILHIYWPLTFSSASLYTAFCIHQSIYMSEPGRLQYVYSRCKLNAKLTLHREGALILFGQDSFYNAQDLWFLIEVELNVSCCCCCCCCGLHELMVCLLHPLFPQQRTHLWQQSAASPGKQNTTNHTGEYQIYAHIAI